MLSTLLYFSIILYYVYLSSELTLTIPQVKPMSRAEELYQEHKERISGALKVPFGEEIPNYDGIYRDAEKLLLEGCSVEDHIAFWRHHVPCVPRY